MVACLSQHENTPAPEREREMYTCVYLRALCLWFGWALKCTLASFEKRERLLERNDYLSDPVIYRWYTHTHIITITAFRNNTDTLEFWRRKKEIFSFERQRWRTWNSCPCCYLLAGRDLNHLLNMRATKIIKLSQSWKRNKRRKKRNVGGRETTDK